MEKIRLGKTEIMASKIGFGCLPLQRRPMDEVTKLLRKAYDSGTNYFDTARMYSDSEEKIGAAFGMEHMLYALMRVSVGVRPEGYLYDPRKGHVEFGEKDNQTLSPRVQAVARLFDRAGIPYKIPEDMLHALWFKYLCNIGENLTCALLGIPFGAFRTSEDANFIRHAAMREVASVAAAYGVHFTEEELARQDVVVTRIPALNKPSTLQDIENKRPTEIAMFSGTLIKLREKAGVSTPFNQMFYHGIRVLEQKNNGDFQFGE